MGNFVDHVKITCKAGNGGNGSMSFHREKFVLNGGPDGGDGGNGGNVCFYADLNMHTLLDFRFKSKYTAENGVDGAAGNCTGKRGEDLIIKVPVGTVIREAESGAVVADMDTAGETRTILHGGRGGWAIAISRPRPGKRRTSPSPALRRKSIPFCWNSKRLRTWVLWAIRTSANRRFCPS